jgi:photosystem II PsbU protein
VTVTHEHILLELRSRHAGLGGSRLERFVFEYRFWAGWTDSNCAFTCSHRRALLDTRPVFISRLRTIPARSVMAFVTGSALPVTRAASQPSVCSVRMSADETPRVTRRAAMTAAVAAAAAALIAPVASQANIEYANVGYLGGGDQIDVNNANVRAYLKIPGFYPGLAGLIVKNAPYKSTDEINKIPELTETMKATLVKYKENLVALEPAPEYQIDMYSNGLYR